jgi:hypothetical protein
MGQHFSISCSVQNVLRKELDIQFSVFKSTVINECITNLNLFLI